MRVVFYVVLFLISPLLAWGQEECWDQFIHSSQAYDNHYVWSLQSENTVGNTVLKFRRGNVIRIESWALNYVDKINKVSRSAYFTKSEYLNTHHDEIKIKLDKIIYEKHVKEGQAFEIESIAFEVLDTTTIEFKNYNFPITDRIEKLSDSVRTLKVEKSRTRRELREMFLDEKFVPHAFMFCSEYSLGWASRVLTINRPDKTTQQLLNQRNQTERYIRGSRFAAKVGYSYKRNHNFYLGYYRIKQGFESDGTIVDFYSSKSSINSSSNSYIFRYWGGEIGYRYSGSRRNINPVLDVGFGVQKLKSKEYTILQFINQETVSLKIGIGFNYRPGVFRKNVELYIVPTFYKNLKAVDYGPIKTNLHYFGINSGLAFYLHN